MTREKPIEISVILLSRIKEAPFEEFFLYLFSDTKKALSHLRRMQKTQLIYIFKTDIFPINIYFWINLCTNLCFFIILLMP